MKGRQPLWPEAIERNYIRPAAERAKITMHISWHVFRHTFSTLLAENDGDVKTVQSLMSHANSNITMNIYSYAVSSKKRRAQSKVVEMILSELSRPAVSAGVAVYFLVYRTDFPKAASSEIMLGLVRNQGIRSYVSAAERCLQRQAFGAIAGLL